MAVKAKFYRGAWWLFIHHAGNRTKKRIGKSKDAAMIVAQRIEQQLALNDLGIFGKGATAGDAGEPFSAYATRWLNDGESGRKATYHRWLRMNINEHLAPTIGDRPIGTISRGDARSMVAALRKKGAKIHVIKGAVRTASAVVSQAVDDGLRQANPFFRMGKHTQSADEIVNDAEVRAMSRDQVRTLLETAATSWPDYYVFYLTAVRTGMRLGELLGLKWADVDVDGRVLNLKQAYTGGRFTTLKNKKRRPVEMSDQLAVGLQAHRIAMKERALKAGLPVPELLFCSPEGVVWDPDNLRKRVHAKLTAKAKLAGFTLHELRHTYASLLIAANKSLAYISRQMGHSSIQITVDTYGHMIPSSDRSAVNALDDQPVLSTSGVGVK